VQGFFAELNRRNVSKVALVYIIAGWLTMQVVDVMFPALQLPEWLTSAVAALLIIGFPFALIFAWAFELTPDGIKREKDVDRSKSITPQTGQKLNHVALVILTIAVSFLLVDKFVLESGQPPIQEPVATAPDEKPSIAVLPFVNMRVFLRRPVGGTPEPAGQNSPAARRRPDIVFQVQGNQRGSARHRRGPQRQACARGQRAEVGIAPPDHGAAYRHQ
jgi:hypothetical protein